jgi:hypothetical protein
MAYKIGRDGKKYKKLVSGKVKDKTDSDINLTVYINIIKEEDASPEQKAATEHLRKIFSNMIEED